MVGSGEDVAGSSMGGSGDDNNGGSSSSGLGLMWMPSLLLSAATGLVVLPLMVLLALVRLPADQGRRSSSSHNQ
jgi:hypothetical protein